MERNYIVFLKFLTSRKIRANSDKEVRQIIRSNPEINYQVIEVIDITKTTITGKLRKVRYKPTYYDIYGE